MLNGDLDGQPGSQSELVAWDADRPQRLAITIDSHLLGPTLQGGCPFSSLLGWLVSTDRLLPLQREQEELGLWRETNLSLSLCLFIF